jgi:hypothetical protein
MSATIYNSNLTKEIIETGKLQTSVSLVPSELAEKVIAVIDVNPNHNRYSNFFLESSVTSSGVVTLYTVPVGKKVLISNTILNFSTDNASDSVYLICFITSNGSNNTINQIRKLTLTSVAVNNTISYPIPIILKTGDSIKIDKTHSLGSNSYTCNIIGQIIEE